MTLDEEMFDIASKPVSEVFAMSQPPAAVERLRGFEFRPSSPCLAIAAFGAAGLSFEFAGRCSEDELADFYRKASDFVAVDLLGVQRSGLLVTTSQWRRIRPQLEAMMRDVYGEMHWLCEDDFSFLGESHVTALEELFRRDTAHLEPPDDDEDPEGYMIAHLYNASYPLAASFNDLCAQEGLSFHLSLERFGWTIPLVLARVFQLCQQRFGNT